MSGIPTSGMIRGVRYGILFMLLEDRLRDDMQSAPLAEKIIGELFLDDGVTRKQLGIFG